MRSEGEQLAADVLRRQLARSGGATLRMRGHSMRPLLPDGARVALRPVDFGEDLTGRIVAVDTGSRVVVHRVTRASGSSVETRGLARAIADPPWPRTAVIGVARARWLRPAAAAVDAAVRLLRSFAPPGAIAP